MKKKTVLKEELKKYAHFGYDYVETEYANHASELAKKAIIDNYDLIVAAGGDGTVNEIASKLTSSDVILGIIPMGSGNGLARHLQIPLDIKKAIQYLAIEKSIKIDEGKIDHNSFFCVAGIGFDAEVSKLFADSKTRGLKTYIYLAIKSYLSFKPKKYKVIIDQKSTIQKPFLMSFANTSQFGNNAYISPSSKVDDGILDLSIIEPFPIYTGLALFVRLFNKSINKYRYFKSYSGTSFEVEINARTIYHCDGEVYESNKDLKVIINKRVLNVLSTLEPSL